MKKYFLSILIFSFLLLTACSDSTSEKSEINKKKQEDEYTLNLSKSINDEKPFDKEERHNYTTIGDAVLKSEAFYNYCEDTQNNTGYVVLKPFFGEADVKKIKSKDIWIYEIKNSDIIDYDMYAEVEWNGKEESSPKILILKVNQESILKKINQFYDWFFLYKIPT